MRTRMDGELFVKGRGRIKLLRILKFHSPCPFSTFSTLPLFLLMVSISYSSFFFFFLVLLVVVLVPLFESLVKNVLNFFEFPSC